MATIDLAKKQWPKPSATRRNTIKQADSKTNLILVVAVIFCVSVTSLMALRTSASEINAAASVTGAVTDNLMSDEMAEHIADHPGIYDEGDMQ